MVTFMIKKGDILIIFILVLAGFSWFVVQWHWNDATKKQVVIEIDGHHYQTLPINYNSNFKIKFPQNKFIELTIKNDQVWVVQETVSCPKKICIKTGKISKVGQSIVCLPNKAVVYIEGKSEEVNKVDEVVF